MSLSNSLYGGSARVGLACLLSGMLTLLSFSLPALADEETPDQVVNSVARDLLTDISNHRAEYHKDPAQLRKVVDKYLLPRFDSEYAAKLVLSKHWREATPEQRKQFIDGFYQSLIANYGEAVVDFTLDRLKILPYKGNPGDTNATVRSEISRSNGTTVPVNYTLHKVDGGWKAFDVTIEGVSYVKSFRTDFGTEIDQKGLDAVIKRLQSQQTPIVDSSGKPTSSAPTKKSS
jgi:phospholipid transport system substrate-binding protein